MSGYTSNATAGTREGGDYKGYSNTGKSHHARTHTTSNYATGPIPGEEMLWATEELDWRTPDLHAEQHTREARSSVAGDNVSKSAKDKARKFLEEIKSHEKGVRTSASRNRGQLLAPQDQTLGNRGGFSFSKGRYNESTPDAELIHELGPPRLEKELDQNKHIEDSFFKDEMFKPTINAKSLEIAEAIPKRKPIEKRYREEVAEKVKKIKKLAKQVAQEKKDKEFEEAKRALSHKTELTNKSKQLIGFIVPENSLSSKLSRSAKKFATVEVQDTYTRNKLWAESLKTRVEHAQKLQKLKELAQEREHSYQPMLNPEDRDKLVKEKVGLGRKLSQMEFTKRQQEFETQKKASTAHLGRQLQQKECPFAPRTNLSRSASRTKGVTAGTESSKSTTATELRMAAAKSRITELKERIAKQAEEKAAEWRQLESGKKRVQATSEHLYQPSKGRKMVADIGRGLSPTATVTEQVVRPRGRERLTSPTRDDSAHSEARRVQFFNNK